VNFYAVLKNPIFDSSQYTDQLYSYFANDHIKAILLKIDSPGGAAGSGFALYNEIKALKKEYPKPIITLVENICTSSAYLIATATDHIITSSMATIANIGSYTSFVSFDKLLAQYNIEYNNISAGAYKTIGDPLSPMTDEQKELLQGVQNDAYKQFVEIVAKERKLSLIDINIWADGKIFTGKQAMQIGLADSIGSLQHTKQIIKKKAFIDGEILWVSSSKKNNIISQMVSSVKKQFFTHAKTMLHSILTGQLLTSVF